MDPVPALLVVQPGIVLAVRLAIVQKVVRRARHNLAVILFVKLRQHVLPQAKLGLERLQREESLPVPLGLLDR